MRLPSAVLWDLDGTLVDSEPEWMMAQQALARSHGVTWTHEDSLALVGSSNAGPVMHDRGVPLTADEIVELLTRTVAEALARAVPWQPGAIKVLAQLRAAEVRCALVTASHTPIAEQIVAGAPAGTFEVVVSGDSVTNGKPHPEPYLTAARRLDVDITRCVAIEDSLSGLTSAHAAGAVVLGVQRAVPIPAAPGRSRVSDLSELSLEDLGRIAAGEVLDNVGRGVDI